MLRGLILKLNLMLSSLESINFLHFLHFFVFTWIEMGKKVDLPTNCTPDQFVSSDAVAFARA